MINPKIKEIPNLLAGKNQSLRLVAVDEKIEIEGDIEVESGIDWPLLKDGTYMARFIKQETVPMKMFKGAIRIYGHFEIIGEQSPIVIYGAWPVKTIKNGNKSRTLAGRRSNIYLMLCRVHGYRIRPDRISLKSLEGCTLKVKTRTVKKDYRQRETPPALWYSVIDNIEEIVEGNK